MAIDSEYRRGFARCLSLRDSSSNDRKYSERFQHALRAYFDSYGFLAHPRLESWWKDHTGLRVAHAFNVFIPWCLTNIDLSSASVLEIGCGTGSSTVALAAHANNVVACDIHAPSIEVARIRLEEDGYSDTVKFRLLDPGLGSLVNDQSKYDVIVMYALLEHMLPQERGAIFQTAWKLLSEKGAIVIYETPNRLLPVDRHTTGLRFWHWLPPKQALAYGKWRGRFSKNITLEQMYREGYGLSYRELIKCLNGKSYRITFNYVREQLWKRAIIRFLMLLLRVPRWGFGENLNIKIFKEC